MIIQAGSAEFFIFPTKAQRLYKMEFGTGIGAKSNDVAGVRRNFRLVENDVKYSSSIFLL